MKEITGVAKKETLEISEILARDMNDCEVKVNGTVHAVRDMGEVAFFILRKREGLLQCVWEESVSEFKRKEIREGTAVEFTGYVRKEERAPQGFEIRIRTARILSEPVEPMPLPVSKLKLHTSLEAKLNNRAVSLRNTYERAKFRIQEGITRGFRDFLYGQ